MHTIHVWGLFSLPLQVCVVVVRASCRMSTRMHQSQLQPPLPVCQGLLLEIYLTRWRRLGAQEESVAR
jgi:hypothetical protein